MNRQSGTFGLLQPSVQRAWIAVVLLLVLLLFASCSKARQFNGTPYDPILPAPKLEGTNWDGQPFAMSDLRGKVVLLFFGYTFCPDVCPLTLAEMKAVVAELGEDAKNVAVVFVSTDPERDTPERLAPYMQAFDPSFYGVSVPLDALETVKKDYGVYAEKRLLENSQSATDYLIDHTGWTYLIDGAGNLRAIFSVDMSPEQIVPDVTYLVDEL